MDLEKLKQEMLSNGYMVENLIADGEYQRFAIDGHKGVPGYYSIRQSAYGYSAVYGDFVSGNKYRWTAGNNSQALTPEQAEKFKRQLAKEAAELEAKIKRKHEKGADAARFFWGLGEDFKTHGYLSSKRVKNYGLKLCTVDNDYNGWLMVPGYNADGEIATVQYISRDGFKRFETDGKKKGAFFEIPGNNEKIIICEGYSTGATIRQATGQTVIVSFDAGNQPHVAKIIREKYPDNEIIIAADNDQYKPEIGNVGVNAATDAAIQIDARLAIPQFKNTDSKPTDFNDLARLEGVETVKAQIEAAAPINKADALKVEIKKILNLDPLEQEAERSRLAKKYNVRKSAIDQYIIQLSKVETASNAVVDETEPAADPVDGERLLNGILAGLKQRVILPAGAAVAITLWILLTYCHKAFNVLPLLGITSPTKRCGKTTLIEILQGLTSKGLTASSLTAAAVFRTIEKYSPTLLIDEADTFLKDNDELRGIINSGHTRASAFVIRVEGDSHEPVKFSTWGPKAIGMIGSLPDTIEDRALVIQLARKMPGEKIIKTGLDFAERCLDTRARCRRWADDNFDRLKTVSVPVPSSGNDRADDNWQPLFTIAHIIGGDWPEKVRASMQQIVRVSSDEAIGIKLLSDIRDIFDEKAVERIFSKDLVEALKELSESQWADWNRGKGLSSHGLSRLLKPFGIQPKTMRIDFDRYKGYSLESFQDAFNRYLPRDPSVTPCQSNYFNDLGENPNVTPDIDVTDENDDNQLNLFTCHDVTDEIRGAEGKEEKLECHGCRACDKNTMTCYSVGVFEGKSGAGVPCRDAIKTCEYNKE